MIILVELLDGIEFRDDALSGFAGGFTVCVFGTIALVFVFFIVDEFAVVALYDLVALAAQILVFEAIWAIHRLNAFTFAADGEFEVVHRRAAASVEYAIEA